MLASLSVSLRSNRGTDPALGAEQQAAVISGYHSLICAGGQHALLSEEPYLHTLQCFEYSHVPTYSL